MSQRDARGRFIHRWDISHMIHPVPPSESENHRSFFDVYTEWSIWEEFQVRGFTGMEGGMEGWCREKYHCPPVPPRGLPQAMPRKCEVCERMFDWPIGLPPQPQCSFQKWGYVSIYCRDGNQLSTATRIGCGEFYRLMMALHPDNTPFSQLELDYIEINKIRLPHGGEMIL